MSGLTLYASPTSPYVRKVMVVLYETGQTGEVAIQHAQGTPLDAARMPLAQNPLGKVPVLAVPEGPALFDSRVICRYLNARAGTRLYPAPPREWQVLTLEALADGILDAALAMSYEVRLRPEAKRSSELVEAYWAKIDRAVSALAGRWMSHLAGPLDVGQIAVAVALGYLDFRQSARGWRRNRPDLSAWADRMLARPSFLATAPPEGA